MTTERKGDPIAGSKLFRDFCSNPTCGEPIRVYERDLGKANLCDTCRQYGRREIGEVRTQQNVRGKSEQMAYQRRGR